MQLSSAIEHHQVLAVSVANAVESAGPVGHFEIDPDYVESRDPCDSTLTTWQAWTARLSAIGSDPNEDAFWDTTWPAARGVADQAGFHEHVVLDDSRGSHAVEFSDGSGALILLMAVPRVEDPTQTRTSVVVRTGCHPDPDRQGAASHP